MKQSKTRIEVDPSELLCYENRRREKVYIGTSNLVPTLHAGQWHGFAEPDGSPRIPVRPGRYCHLPLLIPNHGRAVAWGVFARATGGEPMNVMFRPGYGPAKSKILGADGRPL